MFFKYSLAPLFLWTASQVLLGCDADLEVKEIDHEVFQENFELTVTVTANEGPDGAYWWLEFADEISPYANMAVNSWCVDFDRLMEDGVYKMDTFSAYDDFHTDAVDNPQNLPMINYMIKNFPIHKEVIVDDDCKGFVTWTEFQYAVWTIIDDYTLLPTDWDGVPAWWGYPMMECVKEYMVRESMKHGADFEPSCEDPLAEIAVILIVDNEDEFIEMQVLVAEILLSSIPGACIVIDHDAPTIRAPISCEDGIAVEVIDHEVFQENFELTVSVTANGGDEQSYWWLEFDEDEISPYAGLTVNAWCVDFMRPIYCETYKMDTFSAWDDFHSDAVDQVQNLPMVNYLFKHFPLLTEVIVDENCFGTVSWTEMQYAVWTIIDDYTLLPTDWDGVEPWWGETMVECLKEHMVFEALKHGADFEPSCDDPLAEIAVILIVDDEDEFIEAQVLVAEILLSSIPGACVDVCDVPSIDGPTLSCVEDLDLGLTSNTICDDNTDVVQFVDHVGNDAFKDLIDDMDIIYDLEFTAEGTVKFKVMNPFGEEAADFYVVADIPRENAWEEKCVEDVFHGDECAEGSDTFEAYCHSGYEAHGERARTFIHVYFQSNASIIGNGGGIDVDECCHPDESDAPVVEVTFSIYCECPPDDSVSRALLRGA